MIPLRDEDLLAWLSGATTPGRSTEIADEVAASRQLQDRVAALRDRLNAGTAPRSGWRLPLPGQQRGIRAERVGLVLGEDDAVPPGGRISIRLWPVSSPERRAVVVLRRDGADWRVLLPVSEEDVLLLTELPENTDGTRLLELRAPGAAGDYRYAVVLPLDLRLDWAAGEGERWAGLMEEITRGTVPVFGVGVRVR